MSYQPPANAQTPPPYSPTDAQKARAVALKRFNWLYVYTPLIIGAIILVALIALMFWAAFAAPVENSRQFLSGLADMVVIFIAVPMTLLCAIGPILLVGLIAYPIQQRRRRQESGIPAPQGGRLQMLLWRLDALLNKMYGKIVEILPRVARPIIQMHGLLAYAGAWLARLKELLTRSKK